MVRSSEKKVIPIPARYETVAKKEKVEDARWVWRRTVCDVEITPAKVLQIQRALRKAKYKPGKIDGIYGSDTRRAVEAFQRDHELATGSLTIETLRELGVDF